MKRMKEYIYLSIFFLLNIKPLPVQSDAQVQFYDIFQNFSNHKHTGYSIITCASSDRNFRHFVILATDEDVMRVVVVQSTIRLTTDEYMCGISEVIFR